MDLFKAIFEDSSSSESEDEEENESKKTSDEKVESEMETADKTHSSSKNEKMTDRNPEMLTEHTKMDTSATKEKNGLESSNRDNHGHSSTVGHTYRKPDKSRSAKFSIFDSPDREKSRSPDSPRPGSKTEIRTSAAEQSSVEFSIFKPPTEPDPKLTGGEDKTHVPNVSTNEERLSGHVLNESSRDRSCESRDTSRDSERPVIFGPALPPDFNTSSDPRESSPAATSKKHKSKSSKKKKKHKSKEKKVFDYLKY